MKFLNYISQCSNMKVLNEKFFVFHGLLYLYFDFFAGIIKTKAVLDIETKSHYWLTVFAQDHGVVPLFSSVEVSFVSKEFIL